LNVIAGEAKVQRHCPRSGPYDPKVSDQPIDGVHHEVNNLVPLLDPPLNQGIGTAVCGIIELLPRDFPSLFLFRDPFNESGIRGVQAGVPREYFTYVDVNSHRLPRFLIKVNDFTMLQNPAFFSL
jgi:hypothetical protein